MLDILPDLYTALITGASSGIGYALLNQLLPSSRAGRIITVTHQLFAIDDERVISLRRGTVSVKAATRRPASPFVL